MDTLGAALVVTGIVIAGCALAALAVLGLVALVPWSRFRPRYQRGTAYERGAASNERAASALAALGRSVWEAGGDVRRRLVGSGPVSRHPRGPRHLHPLGR